MIPKELMQVLMLGTGLMMIPVLIVSICYRIQWWKSIPLSICLTAIGTIGTYLLFYVENGEAGGISFYGAVFLIPAGFWLVSKVLCVSYGQALDCCAPAVCVMLALMKTQCLMTGCCGGKVLYINDLGKEVVFPSQIAELVNALVLMVILLFLVYKRNHVGRIYPIYMVTYGITRFVLNLFRANQSVFLLGMAPGNFWSIISIMIGLAWLLFCRKKETDYFIHSVI